MRNLITCFLFFALASMVGAGDKDPFADLYRPTVGEVGYGILVSENFTMIGESLPVYPVVVPASSVVGDLVYLTSPSTAALSDASASPTARVDGFVYEKITSTTARIRTNGKIIGLSGLTGGTLYYLDDATPGKLTDTPPAIEVPVGYAVDSTTISIVTAIDAFAAALDASDLTLQEAYDNGTTVQTIDLGVSGRLSLRTNGGTELLSVDETGFVTHVYDNSTSGLTATEISAAVDEIEARVDLNDLKVSADGSIDTHSDVDTTTTPPSIGQVLEWDGGDWVPNSLAPDAVSTGANVGTSGVGPFLDLTGSIMRFKNVNSANDTIVVTEDVANAEIDLRLGTVPIDDLSDVDTTTVLPLDGQALVWDSGDMEWAPGTVLTTGGGGGGALVPLEGATFVGIDAADRSLGTLFLTAVPTAGDQSGTVNVATVNGGRTIPANATHVEFQCLIPDINITVPGVSVSYQIAPAGTSLPDANYTCSFTNAGALGEGSMTSIGTIILPIDPLNPNFDWYLDETLGGTYGFMNLSMQVNGWYIAESAGTSVSTTMQGKTFLPLERDVTDAILPLSTGGAPLTVATALPNQLVESGSIDIELNALSGIGPTDPTGFGETVPPNATHALVSLFWTSNTEGLGAGGYEVEFYLDNVDGATEMRDAFATGANFHYSRDKTYVVEIDPSTPHLQWSVRTGPSHTAAGANIQLGIQLQGFYIDETDEVGGAGELEGFTTLYVDPYGPTDPEPTGTTFVTIDLSKDNAPENATGALISYSAGLANTAATVLRPDSSTAATECSVNNGGQPQAGQCVAWFEPGTQQFEAAFSLAPGAISQNQITVFGYFIEDTGGLGPAVLEGYTLVHVDAYGPTDPEPVDTTWTVIDLDKDGAPDNAVGAVVTWNVNASAAAGNGEFRRDSGSTPYRVTAGVLGAAGADTNTSVAWFSPGTKQFEARHDGTPTLAVNEMEVIGYYITDAGASASLVGKTFVPSDLSLRQVQNGTLVGTQTPDFDIDLSAASIVVPEGATHAIVRIELDANGGSTPASDVHIGYAQAYNASPTPSLATRVVYADNNASENNSNNEDLIVPLNVPADPTADLTVSIHTTQNTAPSSALNYRVFVDGFYIEDSAQIGGVAVNENYIQARRTSPQSIPTGVTTTIVFATEVEDQSNNYDPLTGIYTASVDGYYSFSAHAQFDNLLSPVAGVVSLYKNLVAGGPYPSGDPEEVYVGHVMVTNAGETDPAFSVSAQVHLKAGDEVVIRVSHNDAAARNISGGWFTGLRVGPEKLGVKGAAYMDDLLDADTSTTPPSVGELLQWDGANWVNVDPLTVGAGADYIELTETAPVGTTSAAYVTVPGMSSTPSAGTWMVNYSTSGASSNNAAVTQHAIFVAGVIVPHTERVSDSNQDKTIYTQGVVTVNGAEVVDVRHNTSAGTLTVNERNMFLKKLTN